jgi:hypothetical protein
MTTTQEPIPELSQELQDNFKKNIYLPLKYKINEMEPQLLYNSEGHSEAYIIEMYNRPNNFFNIYWEAIQKFYSILKNATNNHIRNSNNMEYSTGRLSPEFLSDVKVLFDKLQHIIIKIKNIIDRTYNVNLVIDNNSIINGGNKKKQRKTHNKRKRTKNKRFRRNKTNKK